MTDAEIIESLRTGKIPSGLYVVQANLSLTKRCKWRPNRYLCDSSCGATRGKIYADGSGYVGGTSLDFSYKPRPAVLGERTGKSSGPQMALA